MVNCFWGFMYLLIISMSFSFICFSMSWSAIACLSRIETTYQCKIELLSLNFVGAWYKICSIVVAWLIIVNFSEANFDWDRCHLSFFIHFIYTEFRWWSSWYYIVRNFELFNICLAPWVDCQNFLTKKN